MPTIGKGSIFSMDVATVLTAIAEVETIDYSGAESETFKYSNLSTTGAGHEYLATGFSEGGSVETGLFFLPANSGHQAITDEITTPTTVVADQLDGQVTFADTASTTMPFKIAGIGFGFSISGDGGTKSQVTFKTNGLPTYAT